MDSDYLVHTKYWDRTSTANFVKFLALHPFKHENLTNFTRFIIDICHIFRNKKSQVYKYKKDYNGLKKSPLSGSSA
jgi:hypothetical protein